MAKAIFEFDIGFGGMGDDPKNPDELLAQLRKEVGPEHGDWYLKNWVGSAGGNPCVIFIGDPAIISEWFVNVHCGGDETMAEELDLHLKEIIG